MVLNGQARNEELARAAEEQQEGNSSASTSGSTNGSGGNNGGLSSAARTMSADVVAYMEDYDTSIPNLNNVCIWYLLPKFKIEETIVPTFKTFISIGQKCRS